MASSTHTFNARDFRSRPIYRHTAPIADIQGELASIANFYHRIERQYNYFTVALIICTSVPLVLLFMLPLLRELGWLMILGFVLIGIYSGSMRNRAKQWQYPRDRDRLFNVVLSLVKRDIAPEEPLEVQLCLGSLAQTGQALQQRSVPGNPSQQLEDWRNPWFAIKGRFLDDSFFSLRLVEQVSITTLADNPQNQTKPTASCCDGFDLTLQLHVEPSHYGNLTPFQSHLADAVKLLPGATLIKHYSAGQDLSLTVNLPPTFTASLMYQSITLLFLSAYHILHLAAQLNEPIPSGHLPLNPANSPPINQRSPGSMEIQPNLNPPAAPNNGRNGHGLNNGLKNGFGNGSEQDPNNWGNYGTQPFTGGLGQ